MTRFKSPPESMSSRIESAIDRRRAQLAEDSFKKLVESAPKGTFVGPVHLLVDDKTALAGRPEGGRACASAEVDDGHGYVYVTWRFLTRFTSQQQDGVLRHELAHIALLMEGKEHTEREADEKARQLWGKRIRYDSKDIQTTGVGTYPRPAKLDAGENPVRSECVANPRSPESIERERARKAQLAAQRREERGLAGRNRTSLRNAVFDYLAREGQSGATVQQIGDAIGRRHAVREEGFTEDGVRKALHRLVREGYVDVNEGHGVEGSHVYFPTQQRDAAENPSDWPGPPLGESPDDPDYNWYVVFDDKIATANEYKEDARPWLKHWREMGRTDAKIVSRRRLKTHCMLDPTNPDHWHSEGTISLVPRAENPAAPAVEPIENPNKPAFVWRVENEEGVGPYQGEVGIYADGFVLPEHDLPVDRKGRRYWPRQSPSGSRMLDHKPAAEWAGAPDSDEQPSGYDDFEGVVEEKDLFGFATAEDAIEWFGALVIEKLASKGWHLKQAKPTDVRVGKSKRQVIFFNPRAPSKNPDSAVTTLLQNTGDVDLLMQRLSTIVSGGTWNEHGSTPFFCEDEVKAFVNYCIAALRSAPDVKPELGITKEVALNLKPGDHVYHYRERTASGSPLKARVAGKCETWKTHPGDFRLPIRMGMARTGAICEGEMVRAKGVGRTYAPWEWRLTEKAAFEDVVTVNDVEAHWWSQPHAGRLTMRACLRLTRQKIWVTEGEWTSHRHPQMVARTTPVNRVEESCLDEWRASPEWEEMVKLSPSADESEETVYFEFDGATPPWQVKHATECAIHNDVRHMRRCTCGAFGGEVYEPTSHLQRGALVEAAQHGAALADDGYEPEENPTPLENPGAWHPTRVHALFGYGSHIPKDAEDERMYRGVRVRLRKSKATNETQCRRCAGTGIHQAEEWDAEPGEAPPQCTVCGGTGIVSRPPGRGGRGHRIVVDCPCGKTVGFGRIEQHAKVCDEARATFYAPKKICNCDFCATNLREFDESECPNKCKWCGSNQIEWVPGYMGHGDRSQGGSWAVLYQGGSSDYCAEAQRKGAQRVAHASQVYGYGPPPAPTYIDLVIILDKKLRED